MADAEPEMVFVLPGEATARRDRPDRNLLGSCWILEGTPVALLDALASVCTLHRFTAGDVIFDEGDPTDGLYLVVSGTVRIVTHATNGDLLLTSVGAGQCFGEMGVIDGSPRSAKAVAGTFTLVCYVPGEEFLDLLELSPMVSMRLLALLSERLRRTNRLLSELPGEVTRVAPQPLEA